MAAPTHEAARPKGLRNNPWVREHRLRVSTVLGACVSLGVFAVVIRQLGWDFGPLPAMLALLPALGVLCLGVAVLAWRLHLPAISASGVSVTVVVALLWWPAFTVDAESTPIAGAAAVRVMSFNCMSNAATADALANAALAGKVDVVEVVEAVPLIHADLLHSRLAAEFPFHYGSATNEVLLFSRMPLSNVQPIGMFFGGLSADVNLAGAEMRLLAVHPQSPRYTHASAWRRDQERVRELAAAAPGGPLVIAGDLNMTRDNDYFRNYIANGFIDAGDANGRGWEGTWSYGPDNWPLVAIDHFLGRGVHLSDYRTVPISGSDHRAIVTTIQIAG